MLLIFNFLYIMFVFLFLCIYTNPATGCYMNKTILYYILYYAMCIVQSKTELRCGATVDDGVAIYARLVQLYTDPPNNFVRAARPYPACIGSAKFQKV